MKHTLLALLCLVGCAREAPPAEHADHGHGHGHDDEDPRPGLVFTQWDAGTELFVEFPALVVGQESVFAAHLTRLSDFSAIAAGTMTAELGEGADAQRAVADAPTAPASSAPRSPRLAPALTAWSSATRSVRFSTTSNCEKIGRKRKIARKNYWVFYF